MNTAVIDPMARDLPAGATWTPSGRVRTGTGVEIGICAPARPVYHESHACKVQRALLGADHGEAGVDAGGVVCAIALIATVAGLMNAPAIWSWLAGGV